MFGVGITFRPKTGTGTWLLKEFISIPPVQQLLVDMNL